MLRKQFYRILVDDSMNLENEEVFTKFVNRIFRGQSTLVDSLVLTFQLGIVEEIRNASKLDNNLFFQFWDSLTENYNIDDEVAEKAVMMWFFGYGKDLLCKECFLKISDDEWLDTKPILSGNTYKDCPFKLKKPEFSFVNERLEITADIMRNVGKRGEVALDFAYLKPRKGRGIICYSNGVMLKNEGSLRRGVLKSKVPVIESQVRDSDLCLKLLGVNERYEIRYRVDRSLNVALENISIFEMDRVDEQIFNQIKHAAVKLEESDEKSDSVVERTGNDRLNDNKSSTKETGPKETKIIDAYTAPSLNQFRSAVFKEMMFLKNNGGRKYRVSNGKRISANTGAYAYNFEMEAELYLVDDAPITVTLSGAEASGNVLICEGFQITIVVNKDLGERVNTALISVEPWKLLDALGERLNLISRSDKLAIKLLEKGPKLAGKTDSSSIPSGQDLAIRRGCNDDITVIWGPPGTGKTYTMGNIAINAMDQGKSVLIVSHSNISVDGAIMQIVKLMRENNREYELEQGRVLRYGYVRDEVLMEEQNAVAFNFALNKDAEKRKSLQALLDIKKALNPNIPTQASEKLQIEKELKKIRLEVRDEEKRYVEAADIVATTISKVIIDKLFEDKKYDVVMFDEVSMAYVPQIICAATFAKRNFVCVGDFRQLSPIVQSTAKDVLGNDIFAFLGISTGTEKINTHPWLVMLDVQRRMHPSIAAFSNRYVYNRLLKNHESVKRQRSDILEKAPLAGHAVALIDLAGTYCAAAKNSDNSRYNILSAMVSLGTALEAERNGETSVGIITPYAAQTRIIRAMILDLKKKQETNITCATVHQFQGSERNVIIFDAVEAYPFSKAGWLMSKNDNSSVTRLINVAITRARGKFIVVADSRFWLKKFDGTQNIFYNLIRYIKENEYVLDRTDNNLPSYILRTGFGKNIKYFSAENEALDNLDKDISKAKEKIIVSIPDGQLDEENEAVFDILDDAARNGINVLCKTNGYKDLPETWKRIAWGTDNAIFPIIQIDEKVMWYGLPVSRGMFVDGNRGFKTVYHMFIRITGESTLEMIRTLSEIELRDVDGTKKPLQKKTARDMAGATDVQKEEDTGNQEAGLGRFIEEVEKCYKCKSSLKLVHGRSGKTFLKCPSCGEMKYLEPDTINWYITREHVKCPFHHCDIEGKLGPYGVYVKCDRGHYLKPYEI